MAIGGSGTQADPWTIGSSADLVAFAGSTSYWAAGTYAKLTADIDMDGVSFTPIGTEMNNYYGTFNGYGHVISDLTIVSSSNPNLALFGVPGGSATITGISCAGFTISGAEGIGSLIGYSYSNNISVSNCNAIDCTVETGYNMCGALIGSVEGNISNCYTSDCVVNAVGSDGSVGGLSGSCKNISGCYAYNNTIAMGSEPYYGGLTGYNSGTIVNCAVYGGTGDGKLTGMNGGTITNSYTSNNVSSAVFHNRDFWDNNAGGSLSQTYLSWDFSTPVWYWDATANLPVLQQAATAPAIRTKVSGTWKDVDTTLVKVNGTWKEVSKVFTMISGVWKEV